MNCLKCGRETTEERVFCDSCLEEMEKYPVRPGTAVMLPRRKEDTAPKKTKRHVHLAPSMEDQIRSLKRQRFWLSVTAAVVTLLLATAVVLSAIQLEKQELRPGQNYSAMETAATEAAP